MRHVLNRQKNNKFSYYQQLEMMANEYGVNIPTRNLHFIMANMAKRPWQFIVIGLLRSGLDPAELAKQGALF
jgi:hypothetical protein